MFKIAVLFITFLCPACLRAEYTATELFIINWGENPDEFLVRPSILEGADTPEDPDDDIDDPGAGPYKAFVDPEKNFIFISTMDEIKGFTDSGRLMFEISRKSYGYTPYSKDRYPIDLYIDSDNKIYLVFYPATTNVPVIDYSGTQIDSLKPFGEIGEIAILNWTFSGDLSLFAYNHGWVTYRDGEFHYGGQGGILSGGDVYHAIKYIEPDTVKIWQYTDPDRWGVPSWKDSTEVSVDAENLIYAELLNSQEPEHLYILMSFLDENVRHELWLYDLEYSLFDKVVLSSEPMYYDSCPDPFITADGNIYEFRCLEDGLHVIRWSKE